ncbi:ATP-binding cassette sub-family a member 5, partial [Plakobranchus ocellatus]
MYWLLRVLDIRATGGNPKEAFPCLAKQQDLDKERSSTINTDVIEGEDEDVAAERSRVEKFTSNDTVNYSRENGVSGTESKVVAFTKQLRKIFTKRVGESGPCKKRKPELEKTKVAVRNLSIGVDRGEVLGLLGPNGAGKSTALNMMIAETAPTRGKVVVSGHNVRANTLSVLEMLGYCPQHDALWETITLEEHVRCFAAVKGVHPSQLEDVIDFYINNLKIGQHRKKITKKLSGGTKRKLSYMMSMLGSPQLVLMDEPSTGMDPQSKRFLWDTINASFRDTPRGAILTTHYMEEADALCDRVGIMVNGVLQCVGSTQHLKNKFGSGYILEVKLSLRVAANVEDLMDKLEEHLKSLFPDMKTVERFMERAQYSIPNENVTSLGKTFSSLERCKTTHNLEEYSFSQSSLEQ